MATEAGVEPAIQESKSRALPFGYSAMIGKKMPFSFTPQSASFHQAVLPRMADLSPLWLPQHRWALAETV